MNFNSDDKIDFTKDVVKHESAGGFVFYEDPNSHQLYVALLKKDTGEWLIPKGHIKKGEDAQNAAIREIREELMLENASLDEVSFLRVNSYTFNLEKDDKPHQKDVHLYVYKAEERFDISPLKEEGFVEAQWILFDNAISQIAFDKENLLDARRIFYYEKDVKSYSNLLNISSVTIAIPTHNGGGTLMETLDSVVGELESLNIKSKEIIVCTDHCTDDTKEVLNEYVNTKKLNGIEISLIDNKREKGKAVTLNYIFENSRGDFFCVVDDDVVLQKGSITKLLEGFIKDKKLRIAFSSWKRKKLKSSNPWKLFWHKVLGIKFDIQIFKRPSELARGACLMMRRNDYIYLPNVLNEDQFFQYIYWPNTREVKDSVLLFNSVTSISDYYKRFVRIAMGNKQMMLNFSMDRVNECKNDLMSEIDNEKLIKLSFEQFTTYMFYRAVRYFISLLVRMKIKSKKKYEWFRFKQG